MAGIEPGLGENVSRRSDEQNLGPLSIESRLDLDAGQVLEIFGQKIDVVLEGVGLQPHVVAGAVGVGGRLQNPVDAYPDQVQQFAQHHGHLGGVDAVGTEDRTAAALGALIGST